MSFSGLLFTFCFFVCLFVCLDKWPWAWNSLKEKQAGPKHTEIHPRVPPQVLGFRAVPPGQVQTESLIGLEFTNMCSLAGCFSFTSAETPIYITTPGFLLLWLFLRIGLPTFLPSPPLSFLPLLSPFLPSSPTSPSFPLSSFFLDRVLPGLNVQRMPPYSFFL